jgi:flavin-dependent dehydrogenase
MSSEAPTYDVAIIGGGLAGLAMAIQLARAGHTTVLVEKERYPFHKVCGEYVSLESWNFLMSLGLPLNEMDLPVIDKLFLTAPGGKSFMTALPLGGFGISRYTLDQLLAREAAKEGVHLLQETRAEEVSFDGAYQLKVSSKSDPLVRTISAKVCCAAHGKRSNLDVKWKRNFLQGADRKLENYVAVKYHVHTDWPDNVIGLHNFENGYCGISKVEEERYCMCYMTKAEELRGSGGSIPQLEEKVLYQNPFLKLLLRSSTRSEQFPITISQISFAPKAQVEKGVLMLGDAAGLITPLCGNGMSIALHSSKIAFHLVNAFLHGHISRSDMEEQYSRQWQARFSARLRMGRTLQRFFGKGQATDLFVGMFRTFPFLAGPVVKLTHGQPF